MKKRINILINEEARFLGLYYGYWNWFFLFEKDLNELDLEINFYSSINKKFLEGDYLFLNSRSLPQKKDLLIPSTSRNYSIKTLISIGLI